MSSQSFVSNIIIFFNEERFLAEAIASVLAQTYHHWELLLVDDGSTDGSTAIAQKFAQDYSEKIRYLEHSNHGNKGMSATRNLGIKHARGDYIAFLDGDDVWETHKLSEQVAILDAYPEVGMVYGKLFWWYGWTGQRDDSELDFLRDNDVPENQAYPPHDLLTLYLEGELRPPGMGCNPMLRSKVFETTGGYEESFRGMYEDIIMFSKVLLHNSIYVSDHHWSNYRQHADSCSAINQSYAANIEKICTSRISYLNWLKTYIVNLSITDQRLSAIIKKELWFYRWPLLVLVWRILSDRLLDRSRGRVRQKIANTYRKWTREYQQSSSPSH